MSAREAQELAPVEVPDKVPYEVPVELSAEDRIRFVVSGIPPGRVLTYGQVAEQAGLPRRARLVGRILSRLPADTRLPWHRVVAAGGRIAARGGGEREQRRRLRAEGVPWRPTSTPDPRVDLKRCGWLEGCGWVESCGWVEGCGWSENSGRNHSR